MRVTTAAGLAFGLIGSGTVAASAAGTGGGGGAAGTGGGTSGNFQTFDLMFDRVDSSGVPVQGYGQASINYFFNMSGQPSANFHPNAQDYMQTACTNALAAADASRPAGFPAGHSRVVGMFWASDLSQMWGLGEVNRDAFQTLYDQWVAGGRAGVLNGLGSEQSAYDGWILQGFQEGYDALSATPLNATAICIALNESQGADYNMSVTTDKTNPFAMAGSTAPVSDTIHTSSTGSAITENVTADVTLNWSGFAGSAVRSVTKTVSVSNNGTSASPDFAPSDFGWSAWPAGTFWFTVNVPQQGNMAAAAGESGQPASETWSAAPAAPVKSLTVGGSATVLAPDEVLASGMRYDAHIAADANGSSGPMTIYDTLQTDHVFIGADDKDLTGGVTVLGPGGAAVPATVTIDRSVAGAVTVSARIASIPAADQSSVYTMTVPTYLLPTGSDYTLTDGSQVCYQDAAPGTASDCVSGNAATTHKVTPAPDKVWVLDPTGALTTQDPSWTNTQGQDGRVFLPGDAVSAVVDGSVPANLASPFTNFQLTDDWTKAAQYVDFSDASQAHVYYETAPGSGQYTDVTSEFDVSVASDVTTATALPSFLAATARQSGDRIVKLVVSGAFRSDYTTGGQTIELYNDGSEVWNNETQPSNEPPVFTWTPDPNKQVLGSTGQAGQNADASINGMSVWPGQKLEYSVGIDLRVPADTALGLKSLAVQDVYDPQFTPNENSVEFWDSRDPQNPQPVPRSAYTIAWDAATHSFTVTFTAAWIAANVTDQGANSQWNTQGWLTMRLTGEVNPDTQPGSTVQNQAFEVINGVSTATNVPKVTVPTPTPLKEDLSTALQDIEGKTVVPGDQIVYRLTLNAQPGPSQLAYDVQKLGMVDAYDSQYLSLNASDIHVTDKATGQDVTGDFNIQVENGVAYVFAKQVDSVNPNGQAVPGDPQPADLKTYSQAPIDGMNSPIISQDLMGHEYWITMDATVLQGVNGHVIANQAVQNIENMLMTTDTVSNPLADIDPTKDVVVSARTGNTSIDHSTVKLNSTFDYRLNSSDIPANRAYAASSWSITDAFDRVHDQFTGNWAIFADEPLYDGTTLLLEPGELIANSAGYESVALQGLFTVSFDQKTYTLTVTATPKYLALVNSRGDLPAAFSVYTQMIRIAPAAQVDNQATETYNAVDRKTNLVWTTTPEHPSISVVKYTMSQGPAGGLQPVSGDAYDPTAAQLSSGVEVGFMVTNTGDVPLRNVTLADFTVKGTHGQVNGIVCQVPLTPAQTTALGSGAGTAKPKTTAEPIAKMSTQLAVGATLDCDGVLQGIQVGQLHGDQAVATGQSVFTGDKVTAQDSWYAEATVVRRGAVTGTPIRDGANPWLLGIGSGLLALGVVMGTALGIRSRRGRHDDGDRDDTTTGTDR